jgi:hypothetical protein
MTVKHIALLLAVVLAGAPLCGSSAQSQDRGVRQSVQNRLRSVPGIKEQLTVRPLVTPDGLVPDAETAIKVGEAVIFRFFGETPTKLVPFSATLEDGVWVVVRTPPRDAFDGYAEVHIDKKDGTISFLGH